LDYELDAAHNIYWPGQDPIANFCGGCDEVSGLPIVSGSLGEVSFLWESDPYSRYATDDVVQTLMFHGGAQ
jgi:hypothetical protein